jgi:hypothetical protein
MATATPQQEQINHVLRICGFPDNIHHRIRQAAGIITIDDFAEFDDADINTLNTNLTKRPQPQRYYMTTLQTK